MKRTIAIIGGIIAFGLVIGGSSAVFNAHAQSGGNPTTYETLSWGGSPYAASTTLAAGGEINGEVDYDWCYLDESYDIGYWYVESYQPIDPSTMVNVIGGQGENVSVPVDVYQQAVEPTPGCTDMPEEQPVMPPAPGSINPGQQALATWSYNQDTSAYPNGNYTLFATEDPSCTPAIYASESAGGPIYAEENSCLNNADEASLTIAQAPPGSTPPSFSNVAASANPIVASGTVSGDLDGGFEHRAYSVHGSGSLISCPSRQSDAVGTVSWSIDSQTYSNSLSPTQTLAGSPSGLALHGDPEPWCGSNYWSNDFQYSFSVPIDTSSLSPGVHTLYLEAVNGAGTGTTSIQFTVGASVVPTGTITVTSEDASATSVGVPAQWDIIDGASDICGVGGNVCQGSSQTYANQPALGGSGSAGSIDMPYGSISLLDPSALYALKSVQLAPIAQKNVGVINQILSLTQSIFGSTAEAFTIPLANPLAQTLNPGSSTAFIILWDPIADVAVSPAALPLTATTGGTTSGQVQIANTGSPGSTLTWSSSVSYTNGSGWLSVSPSADSLTNGASGNASENATITADASGLSPGTYTGTVTFTGVSTPQGSKSQLASTVTVSFTVTPPSAGTISGVTVNCSPSSVSTNGNSTCSATVTGTGGYSSAVTWSASAGTIDSSGNYTAPANAVVATITATSQQDPTQSGTTSVTVTSASGGPYFSCGGRVCAETVTPGATSCDAACGLSSGVTPVVTCSPSSITTSQTSQCTIDLNGVPQSNATWTVGSGGSGSVNSGGTYTPSGVGTATVNGTLPDGTSAEGTVTVTAPPLPTCSSGSCQATCNSPALNASPSSIVVPESSSLTYGCTNVTQCTLTGGGLNSTQTLPSPGSIDGNATTTPSVTTTYTLTCVNGNYSSDSTSASVQVTVGGSSLCEQNPNGAGCSGQ